MGIYLGCFHFVGTMKNAAVDICVQIDIIKWIWGRIAIAIHSEL